MALIFTGAGEQLIRLYLSGESESVDPEKTLAYGMAYLRIMIPGLLPFALVQSYAGTLRETGETMLPMKAGIVSVLVNLMLNYLLIFGKFGCPKLGAEGAAVATVTARFVEVAIVISWTHRHTKENLFAHGLYRNFHIPVHLAGQILRKGTPLMLNETLWSLGMAALMQCYSVRGLSVVAAMNISPSTISNPFSIVFMAMGNAVVIIVGQLRRRQDEEAKDTDVKLIFFSVVSCAVSAGNGCFRTFLPETL